MTIHDMVESIADFLLEGDTGHLYTLKTPNNLLILIDALVYPVGLGEPNEYCDYREYCEELGYSEPPIELYDMDQEGHRRFKEWRYRVKGIRKGDNVKIYQAGLEVGGQPMTLEYDYGSTSSMDIYLTEIRAPEGEEVKGGRFRNAIRPLCTPEEGVILPKTLRIPPDLHLNASDLIFVQYMAKSMGVRNVQRDLNDPKERLFYKRSSLEE